MNPSLPLSRKPVSGGRPGGGAAAAGPPSVFNWQALRRAEIGVPVAVLGIIMAMILPLPPLLLDLLISLNIAISLLVLLVSMYIQKPVEFSIFPSSLLLLTLFRLALNISSSRLILMNGNLGTSAAGDVIESFGQFVVGGSFIIGLVMFLVLVGIQYVVINHGAVRISEVTARFTLDALPGKQMSIDADLNAGLIDEAEAKLRRKKLAQETEFYGAMDGASRFTQRDAVAGILILLINVIAGFLIGVFQYGMDLGRAFETYTILTIGDGLVTVIPSLMISLAGGLIVTRAASEGQLDSEIRRQVFAVPEPIGLAGFVLLFLALVPGLPKLPFLTLGVVAVYSAKKMMEKRHAEENLPAEPASPAGPAAAKESIEGLLKVDAVAVEVGLGLVRLVEGGSQSPLVLRIAGLRRQMATDRGLILP
ncbi:MAG: FHIPEP family type III secretion protein, partial [Acidobacteriota bacterium]